MADIKSAYTQTIIPKQPLLLCYNDSSTINFDKLMFWVREQGLAMGNQVPSFTTKIWNSIQKILINIDLRLQYNDEAKNIDCNRVKCNHYDNDIYDETAITFDFSPEYVETGPGFGRVTEDGVWRLYEDIEKED